MKGERKVKQEFESSVSVVKVGEDCRFREKNKLEVAKLMNITGLELESSKIKMVKLKKKKEELTYETGQGKVVLNSMQATIFKVVNKLKEMLATESTTNIYDLNKQKIIREFYKSTMEKTQADHEVLILKANSFQDRVFNGVKK